MSPTPEMNFDVDLSHDVEGFLERARAWGDPHPLPFHTEAWLRAWYTTLGVNHGRQPLLVGVRDRATGRDVLLLPLSHRRRWGLSVVEFADATIVDYNLPLAAPGWHVDDATARRLWAAVKQALRGFDVLRIEKMLARPFEESSALSNPLAQALPLHDCDMSGNQFQALGTWEEWRHTLSSKLRRDYQRSWRNFLAGPETRLERTRDPVQALWLLEQIERFQAPRMQQRGVNYVLNEPVYQDFYRRLIDFGLSSSSVTLTAMRDGEEVVVSQLSIGNGARSISLRDGVGGDKWRNCSPGRLIMEGAARLDHEEGLRTFDLGIGAYGYKQTFNVTAIPLYDTEAALSWRGAVLVAAWRLRRRLKGWGWLRRIVRRLTGQAPLSA